MFDLLNAQPNFGATGEWDTGLNSKDYAKSFTEMPNVVHAYNDGGTYRVQRHNGDPNYTQWGNFTVGPDGQPQQVGDWGQLTKRDSPGSNIAQGVMLGGALVGGLGAAGAFSGGAAAPALGNGAFVGEGAMSGVPAWDAAYTNALMPAGAGGGGVAGALGGNASPIAANAGQAIGEGMLGTPYTSAAADSQLASQGLGLTGAELGAYGAAPAMAGGGWGSGITNALSGANSFLKDNSALVNLGGNLLGGVLGSNAAGKASDAQIRAAQESNALLKYMYDQTRSDNMPALEARNAGLGGYQNLLKNPGSITSDPGYQFGLNQGTEAIQRNAGIGQGVYSGATLKALDRYGQDYGGSKFDTALNRYGNLAGMGQVGAGTVANAGMNYGNNAANNITGAGNAAASGYVGSANSWNNALGGALNGWNQNQFLDRLMKPGP